MTTKATYEIRNGENPPFVYAVKPGSRIHQTLEALRKGPVPAPAYTRRSDHVFRMRSEGILIETEFRQQAEDSEHKFGIYHLKSVVVPVSEVSQ